MEVIEFPGCCSAKVIDNIYCLVGKDEYSKEVAKPFMDKVKDGHVDQGHWNTGRAFATFLVAPDTKAYNAILLKHKFVKLASWSGSEYKRVCLWGYKVRQEAKNAQRKRVKRSRTRSQH